LILVVCATPEAERWHHGCRGAREHSYLGTDWLEDLNDNNTLPPSSNSRLAQHLSWYRSAAGR